MNIIAAATGAFERLPLPDTLTRRCIAFLVGRTGRRLAQSRPDAEAAFAADMVRFPIATNVEAVNGQHYELPAAFFGLALGPWRKYSCGLYDGGATDLSAAEERALAETARNADLRDGQEILELGCGWGSLTLWMAEHFPTARITAVSNSVSQRGHIEAEALRRGLRNLRVITADMNRFEPDQSFDRVVSVEMFEHMANWRALLARVRGWLKPDGLLFIHVFTHTGASYRFDAGDRADWIAQHFFIGGMMPSHSLIRQFPELFTVEQEWRWSGTNYERTALDWLANFDRNGKEIDTLMRRVYGDRSALWKRRWRLFFLATAGLFGHDGGKVWGVSHYRLRPTS